MHDVGKIAGGLIVFLVLATSPLWYNALSASTPDVPPLDAPPNGSQQCVEATDYMRANHMDLLNEWRDDVVREGEMMYKSKNLGYVEMSLTQTCMSCHASRDEFCKKCHDYADVRPTCWDCHVESLGK